MPGFHPWPAFLLARPPPFSATREEACHMGSTCWEWKGRTVVVSSSLFHYICCALAALQTDSCIDLLENKNRWGQSRAEDAFVPPRAQHSQKQQQVHVGAQTGTHSPVPPAKFSSSTIPNLPESPFMYLFAQDQLFSRNKIGRQLFLFPHYSS